MKELSIIIPTYNRVNSVTRCVETLLAQCNGQLVEVIVVDDCSTDQTQETLMKIHNTAFHYLRCSTNQGVNVARNQGIIYAQGKFILFVDSDDYLRDSALSSILFHLKKTPEYNHFIWNVSDRENDKRLPINPTIFKYEDWLTGKIGGDFTHCVRSSLLKSNPFFEEFRAFESLNWLRIFKQAKTSYFLPEILCIRDRNTPDSLTSTLTLTTYHALNTELSGNKRMIELHGSDLLTYAPLQYSQLYIRTAILSLLCQDYHYCKQCLSVLDSTTLTTLVLRIFCVLRLGSMLRKAFLFRAKIKHYDLFRWR